MPTFTFLGRVVPGSVKITVNGPPRIRWEWPEGGVTFFVTAHIDDGNIRVTCEVDNAAVPNIVSQAHQRAFDQARTTAGLIVFPDGIGVTVDLHTVIHPDGRQSVLVARQPSVKDLCTAYSPQGPEFGQLLGTAFEDPELFHALNDLIESVCVPHVALRNCGRAMEGLRILVSGMTDSNHKEPAFRRMAEQLNLGANYVKFIMQNSRGPRHATRNYVPYELSAEVLKRSWNVMNRVIAWKMAGRHKLSLTDFPLLD